MTHPFLSNTFPLKLTPSHLVPAGQDWPKSTPLSRAVAACWWGRESEREKRALTMKTECANEVILQREKV